MLPGCSCEQIMINDESTHTVSMRWRFSLLQSIFSFRSSLLPVLVLFLLSHQHVVGNPWEGVKVECNLMRKEMHVEENSCKSNKPVTFTYCQGTCRSASLSSYKYPYYKTRCECCRAVAATVKKIRLYCPHHEGKNITKTEEVYATRNMALYCKCKPCNTSKKDYSKPLQRRRNYRSWFF